MSESELATRKYTLAEIAYIQKLSDEGFTSVETAALCTEKFGRFISRSAIVGLWGRPTIRRDPKPVKIDFKSRVSKGRKTSERKERAKAALEAKEMRIRQSDIWKPLPGIEPVSLIDRPTNGCKWPVGQFDDYGIEKSCGAIVKADGAPYCLTHSFISYQPPRPR